MATTTNTYQRNDGVFADHGRLAFHTHQEMGLVHQLQLELIADRVEGYNVSVDTITTVSASNNGNLS